MGFFQSHVRYCHCHGRGYSLKNFNEIDFTNQEVILRVDFNLPIVNGVIKNDFRLRQSLPTIKHILQHGGRVRIISHFGRPTAGIFDESLSLKILVAPLQQLLAEELSFITDLTPTTAKIALYENIRFQVGEEDNSLELAQKIANLGQIFVLDAFGCAHRAHASVVGVINFVKIATTGLLVAAEVAYLSQVLNHELANSLAIIGGAKISTKIKILKHLTLKFETIIVAGKMANTLLHVRGENIGNSPIEHNMLDIAQEILNSPANIVLPIDGVDQYGKTKQLKNLLDNDTICDIGNNSLALFAKYINKAKLILWNGPMGIFEQEEFSHGTSALAKMIAASNAVSVVGGGETVSAVEQFSDKDKFTHVSTGGGAFLEYLENGTLIALEALAHAQKN
jgi:phosphoglycerate kinase